jgi:hypothetical protein
MPSLAFFALSPEQAAFIIYSAGAVVVFSHDWLWWLPVLDGSASRDFASDLVTLWNDFRGGPSRPSGVVGEDVQAPYTDAVANLIVSKGCCVEHDA